MPRRTRKTGVTLSGVLTALTLILIAFLLTFAPIWGRSRKADGRIVVEVWSWNLAANSLESLTRTFEQRNPGIDIRVVRNGTNMQSRLLLSLVANTGAPDITQFQQHESPKFLSKQRMVDLTARAGKYERDFPAAAWGNCLHEGKLYAIPWDIGPCGVFYKRSIFHKYQVDPDVIETWDDYIEAGKRILERSGGKTQMLPLATVDLMPFFLILMQQNDGGIFNERGELILSSQQNIEGLEVIRKMLDAGIGAPFREYFPEHFASFGNETVASHPRPAWMMDNIKNYAPATAGDWGMFRLPAFRRGGLRSSNVGGSTLAIPSQSMHPEEAWAFVEFALCTVEGQVAQYRDFGLFPAYLPALRDPYFDTPDPFFAGQKIHRLLATDIDKIKPMTRTRDWNDAERIVRQSLSGWAEQRKDNEQFLREVQEVIARKFDRKIAQ